MLLRNAGADVDAFWVLDEFTIYAHQARYEAGDVAADAPLERENLIQSVGVLVSQVEKAITVR